MATYRLYRWLIHRHAGTGNHPGYADVTLHGRGWEGVFFIRQIRHWERLRVELLPTDGRGSKADKEIVKRAMAQSADKWKGRP
jgi:hypothetical protein